VGDTASSQFHAWNKKQLSPDSKERVAHSDHQPTLSASFCGASVEEATAAPATLLDSMHEEEAKARRDRRGRTRGWWAEREMT
jgi:hypothetical protein